MTIKEIISLIQQNKAEYGITLYPPASKSQLIEFEKQLCIKLPDDIAELYRFANGFESEEDMFRIIPLNEILDRSDKYDANTFYIAEYMVYCDMWEVVLDPVSNATYKIQGNPNRTVLTDSFAEFLQRFLRGGVFEIEGLYEWGNQIENQNKLS